MRGCTKMFANGRFGRTRREPSSEHTYRNPCLGSMAGITQNATGRKGPGVSVVRYYTFLLAAAAHWSLKAITDEMKPRIPQSPSFTCTYPRFEAGSQKSNTSMTNW